jgi:hypothetical protein
MNKHIFLLAALGLFSFNISCAGLCEGEPDAIAILMYERDELGKITTSSGFKKASENRDLQASLGADLLDLEKDFSVLSTKLSKPGDRIKATIEMHKSSSEASSVFPAPKLRGRVNGKDLTDKEADLYSIALMVTSGTSDMDGLVDVISKIAFLAQAKAAAGAGAE